MSIPRQRVLVVALTLLILAVYLPAATQGWQHRASFGMRILRAETVVRAVRPGSPADRAGVVVGDRIDVAALGVARHVALMYPLPGETTTVDVIHAGTVRPVTLQATAISNPKPLDWLILGEFVSTAAFIAVGTMLVVLRASPMTWWLWAYCVGIVPINELLEYYAFLPLPRDVFTGVWLAGRTLLGGFSVFPLIPFVLRFPQDRIGGWRARVRPWMISLVGVAFVYYAGLAWFGLRYGLEHYSLLNGMPALLLYVIASTLIVVTYVGARGIDRERLKWAVTGMLVAFAAQILQYVPAQPFVAPVAELASIVMPVCVAYAVLRHRIIDVQFVINRAIVYGFLTAFLLAFVSLLDWFTSRFISEYHLALYLEAGATIAMGFVLDRIHAQLESVTDRVFFRTRHEAEQHLARLARSLSFATRLESIEEALVDEPVRKLHLGSAALFVRDAGTRSFVRGHSSGWNEDNARAFPDDAPFVRFMLADRTHLIAREAAVHGAGMPSGHRAPALFVPVFSRGDLHAFVVYGGHTNATGLDPGEISLLAALGPGAGVAFDHLGYEALRAQLDEALLRVPSASGRTRA
jgi:hypothetical protein